MSQFHGSQNPTYALASRPTFVSDHIEHANDHIEHRSAVEGIIPHKMTISKVLFCNMLVIHFHSTGFLENSMNCWPQESITTSRVLYQTKEWWVHSIMLCNFASTFCVCRAEVLKILCDVSIVAGTVNKGLQFQNVCWQNNLTVH